MIPIVFVFPRVLKEIYYEGCDYHLGAGYIRAYLEKFGVASDQYIDDGLKTVTQTAKAILKLGPDIVGFSVYDANYYYTRLITEAIRAINPTVTIVSGGPSATFSAELILNDTLAMDVVVEGYGEEATLDLVRWRRGELDLEAIPGIVFRRDGQLHRQSKVRRVPANQVNTPESGHRVLSNTSYVEPRTKLDEYPDPYVAGFIPISRVADIGIVTSRGCAFACTFCNFAAMSGRKVTFQSLDTVMEILEFLDANVRGQDKQLVTINDDNFTMHGKRFHELLDRMEKRGFQNLEFWAEMRVEPLEEISLRGLRAAGFREVNFGLESAVPTVLAAIKKVRSAGADLDGYEKELQYVEKIKWAVEGLHKYGVETCVSVIFGSPTETFEDALATINFVSSLPLDRYAHNYITVRLGTELADTFEGHGIATTTVPGRPLPLITHAAYDVHQVPILPHDDSQLPIRGLLRQDAAFLLSGTGNFIGRVRRPKDHGRGGAGARRAKGTPVVFAIRAGKPIDQRAVSMWLASVKPMSSMVWLLQSEKAGAAELEVAFADAGVASLELQIMSIPSHGNDAYDIGGKLTGGKSGTIAIQARHLESQPDFSCPSRDMNSQLLVIDTDEDLRAAAALTAVSEIKVSFGYLQSRTTIKDGCRWSHRSCPAATAERVIVDGADVLTCPVGGPVGRVGDSIEKLKRSTIKIADRERVRRGCDSCVARDRCSQCLFTAPFSVETFCQIQRAGQNLGLLIDGMALAISLMDTSDPIPACDILIKALTAHNTIEMADTTLRLSDCILVLAETANYGYIASSKHGLVAKISAEQRQLIEALS